MITSASWLVRKWSEFQTKLVSQPSHFGPGQANLETCWSPQLNGKLATHDAMQGLSRICDRAPDPKSGYKMQQNFEGPEQLSRTPMHIHVSGNTCQG